MCRMAVTTKVVLRLVCCTALLVGSALSATTFTIRVAEDGEEYTNNPGGGYRLGQIDRGSSDLELGWDLDTNQLSCMRFTNVPIPKGSRIDAAQILFTSKGSTTGTSPILKIWGENSPNPASLGTSDFDFSNRARTSSVVTWSNIPGWTSDNSIQKTPSIVPIVQSITDKVQWSSGNAMVLCVGKDGGVNDFSTSLRRAYTNSRGKGPQLRVTWTATQAPTTSPTRFPTKFPTTANPTQSPTTANPTQSPTTASPTTSPTKFPSVSPTTSPTKRPTTSPTLSPTKRPTTSPTKFPSVSPTTSPTKFPSVSPTTSPTKRPTTSPTLSPTKRPTTSPTKFPSVSPTTSPSVSPTKSPSKSPTTSPSTSPSRLPTRAPVIPTGLGDFAVVGFSSNAPKAVAIVLLADLPQGDKVSLTDNTFRGELPSFLGFKNTEGIVTFTAPPGGIDKGSVLIWNENNPDWVNTQGLFIPSTSGDNIFALHGSTPSEESVSYGFSYNGAFQQPSNQLTAQDTALLKTLSEGSTAVALADGTRAAMFAGPYAGTEDNLLRFISDPARWTVTSSTSVTFDFADLTFSVGPTKSPTASPTTRPTVSPSTSPTKSPTTSPTTRPTVSPSTSPTTSPTNSPTTAPTLSPTDAPTTSPTPPTISPTASPSLSPSEAPTDAPTTEPEDDQGENDDNQGSIGPLLFGLCGAVGVLFAGSAVYVSRRRSQASVRRDLSVAKGPVSSNPLYSNNSGPLELNFGDMDVPVATPHKPRFFLDLSARFSSRRYPASREAPVLEFRTADLAVSQFQPPPGIGPPPGFRQTQDSPYF